MILYIQTMQGHREPHRIANYEDFDKIYELFPAARHIVWGADSLREAAEDVAHYLSEHNMEAWVEDGELSKGLKEKLMSAGIAAATAIAPMAAPQGRTQLGSAQMKAPVLPGPVTVPTSTEPLAEFDQSRPYLPFGKHNADRFLWNIMQIESSGGRNTEHPEISGGAFKGQHAMGRWGLLVPTVKDLVQMKIKNGDAPNEIAAMINRNPDQIKTIIAKRPHIELELARAVKVRAAHGNAALVVDELRHLGMGAGCGGEEQGDGQETRP